MLTVDIENLLNEKNSRELKISLNELINTVIYKFYNILQSDFQNKECSFKLDFDNGDLFYINSFKKDDGIKCKIGYINSFGEKCEILHLQEALNINKYARDIEYKIKNISISYKIEIKGYFTEQNINKIIPIFHENDTQGRHETFMNNNNMGNSNIQIINPQLNYQNKTISTLSRVTNCINEASAHLERDRQLLCEQGVEMNDHSYVVQ